MKWMSNKPFVISPELLARRLNRVSCGVPFSLLASLIITFFSFWEAVGVVLMPLFSLLFDERFIVGYREIVSDRSWWNQVRLSLRKESDSGKA